MSSESWPALPAELADRLRLDDAGFAAYIERLIQTFPAREYAPAHLDHALGYPWPRPAESFVLTDAAVGPWDADLTHGRHALLAIGSNAAPVRLAGKLAHFEDPRDRIVPVEAGALHDFDIGASPSVTNYGSLPATLFPSPGTAVDLAVLWVTDNQLTQLTWSELSYEFGRLTGVRFGDGTPTLYAYVSRFGAFAPDGAPVALAAVRARHRTAPALTQRELLDRVADILGVGTAETLVEAVFSDWPSLLPRLPLMRRRSQPFQSERWTPFTSSPVPGSPADPVTGR